MSMIALLSLDPEWEFVHGEGVRTWVTSSRGMGEIIAQAG